MTGPLALLTFRGRVGRRRYALWGAGLLALKVNLDRLVSQLAFGRGWYPWNYLDVAGAGPLGSLSRADAVFCATLVALALPFVAAGTALTVRRLRDAGLAPGLVVLFFVPVVNLLVFAALCAVPSREAAPREAQPAGTSALDRWIPRSRFGSAAAGVGLTVLVGSLVVAVSVEALAEYGWSLFVGVPFAMGLAASALYNHAHARRLGESVGVGVLAVALGGAALLAIAVEGVICLVMAAPLGAALGALGAAAGWAMRRGAPGAAPRAAASVALVLPLLIAAEGLATRHPPLLSTTTVVVVDAPPDAVWPHVVSFADLPAPADWVFATGIAYPIRARIDGAGVGAVRHCEFSTGAFVEPITVWDAPRRLAFSVAAQPPPMAEWSVWDDIEPAHLTGAFVSERGEFRLTALPGGRTRLAGTTWYRHRIAPTGYWRLWSDAILHRIHARVLRHVATRAEAGAV